ncbi:hypothetical protein ASE85_04265 [Sphingobium sp. Leaf26]|uniref:hypothetical protein n=1 Tax=Sphingobium sp. Leaf26 TaxID=1735693 RepID=UPI0006F3D792|nr:hypothetical protein [Sphingobium sp. Leaf26]KQN10138.1 hypothetical protein ASE85_04265 [Sphingobium sp. Leaf26]
MKLLSGIHEKKVSDVEMGYGSFFYIFFEDAGEDVTKLWVYSTSWALTVNGVGLVSSDDIDQFKFDDLLMALKHRKLIDIYVLDSLEFHIDFEGEVALEMWVEEADPDSLGAVILYRNGEFVDKIKYPISEQ